VSPTPTLSFQLAALVDLLLESTPSPFALQIGAMDGVRFDPIHPFLSRGGWSGLLVEPLPDLHAALVENYRDVPGLRFANVAISDHEGEIVLNRVDPEAIRSGAVPDWCIGISSVFDDRNWIRDTSMTPYVVKQTVRCTTLAALLESQAVDRIDLLQIDTEGYDFNVLKQLDFGRFRPSIVHVEYINLPLDEQDACFELLLRNGYVLGMSTSGIDLLGTTLLSSP
jgi:FkbM family methyltransferase